MKNISNYLKGLAIGLFLSLSIIACTDNTKDEPFVGDFDRSNMAQVITVVVYEDLDAVTAAFRDFLGDELKDAPHPDAIRQGWSYWSKDGSCTIHVAEHSGVNDKNNMETWGHELTHCVYGQWHAD